MATKLWSKNFFRSVKEQKETQAPSLDEYLKKAEAAETYLTKADAAETYEPKAG